MPKKMLHTLVYEVPLGFNCLDSCPVMLIDLEKELPVATEVQVPLLNYPGDGPCRGFVMRYFEREKPGVWIQLHSALRPASLDDLYTPHPAYSFPIEGLILSKQRNYLIIYLDGLTWGKLRSLLDKLECSLCHRLISATCSIPD